MWCLTPLLNDALSNTPKNYSEGELIALFSRLRPLLNEQWPDAGLTVIKRTIPAPNNQLRICIQVLGIPDDPDTIEEGAEAPQLSDPFVGVVEVRPPHPVLAEWVKQILSTLPGQTIAFSVDPESEPAMDVPSSFQRTILERQRADGDKGVRKDPCGGRCLHWFVPTARYDSELGYRTLLKMRALWDAEPDQHLYK